MTNQKRVRSGEDFGRRLKMRRLAKGWSLDDLATEMGGMVTRQALHKYEKQQSTPSPRVLQKIAQVLGVSAAHLTQQPQAGVTFVAYRKCSTLGARAQQEMEARVEVEALERVHLQQLLGKDLDLPIFEDIETLEDAEHAAEKLRIRWNLGVDAIGSLSTILEDHGIHVIEVEAPEKFDGLSAYVENAEGQTVAAAVVAKRDLPGDRWRLTNAHELGHLVLRFKPDATDTWIEKAAFRFGSAFLAPRPLIEREVGTSRHRISPQELFLLKPRLGMSAQAITYRLRELGILSEAESSAIFQQFIANKWRKQEPYPLEIERPTWLKRNTYHALSEGLISRRDAIRLLGSEFDEGAAPLLPTSSRRLRALLRLPLEERRRILEAQSQASGDIVTDDADWKTWEHFSDPIEWADDMEITTTPKAKSAATGEID